MGNVFRLYLAVILIVMFVGCGGNRAGDLSQTQTPGQPTAGQIIADPNLDLQSQIEMLPGLGNDGVFIDDPIPQNMLGGNLPGFPGSGGNTFSPVHKVSEVGFQTDGTGYVDSFGANNRAGENVGEYVLIPEEGDIAWAMYSVANLTGDRPVRVDVSVSPTALVPGGNDDLPLKYWIGVADYTLYHWDWQGPFTSPQEVVINSEELRDRYVSKDGTLHWVAVLYGDEPDGLPGVTIESGTVVTDPDYFTNNPHYTLVNSITVGGASESNKVSSDLQESQYIRIVWNHVVEFGPHDVQNKAFQYKIYRRGPLDLNPREIDSVDSPRNVYIDDGEYGLSEPPIPLPVPGAEYVYYIQALNLIGGYTPLSTPKFATAPLLPPESVTASIRTQLGRINLSWAAAEGADDYLVYRDLQDEPIATTGDVLTWDDDTLDPTDGAEHIYWLRSVNQYVPEGSESFSVPEPGRQDTLPVAELIGAPETGITPLVVGFDAGASHDPDDGTDPGDGIAMYGWDFNGDGIFSGEVGSLPEEDTASGGYPDGSTAQYTYADDGVFNAAVRVTDDEGNYTMQSVEIIVGNSPPVADLGADPLSGNSPLMVQFDASGSTDEGGSIVNYEFDFDDGAGWEDKGLNATPPPHEYDDGTYNAKVRVTDDDGGTDEATVEITVTNTPPTADLQADPTSGEPPLMVNFDASGSTDPDGTITFEFDFGEGTGWEDYGTTATPSHEYTDAGTYTAQLRVTDDDGATDTASVEVIADRRGDWWMFGRDAKHASLSPYNGPATNALDWSYTTGSYIHSSPVIAADGTIYVGNWQGSYLYAINADGSLKWRYTVGDDLVSSQAIARDGTVYASSVDGKLYAINPDGTFKWDYLTGGMLNTSPAIGSDGTIYVGSYDHKLYAINPDGSLKWAFTTGGALQLSCSPAIGADGTVYVGSADDKLYAINPDGSENWTYTVGAPIDCSPAIGTDGTVYVGCDDANVYAINADGSLQWIYSCGGIVHSSPAISQDGIIYVGSKDAKLYALNPNGSLRWTYTTGSEVNSSPTVGADGTVYVGSLDYKLYAINPDGSLKWLYTTGNYLYSSPAIGADGTLYVGSYDNKLYAFQDLP